MGDTLGRVAARLRGFRLSPAMAVALLALFIAMGGSAVAASHYLINSAAQINPKVLKKLKGEIGPAGTAGITGSPGTPGGAGKEGAPGKEGAAGPEGGPGKEGKEGPRGPESLVSGIARWRTTVQTAGKSEAEPEFIVLVKEGPFTVTGHCWKSGEVTDAATYISTSENGVYVEGSGGRGKVPLNVAEGAVPISEEVAEGTTKEHEPSFFGPSDGSWAAESANGSVALNGFANQGVWLQGAKGPACSFSGFLVVE
jgi:collagen triple helix repeat protein